MTNCARWTLLVLLVFAYLLESSGEDWAGVVVQVGSFLVLVLCLLNQKANPCQLYAVPGLLPLAALACLFLVQLLPMPPVFLKLVSPATFRLYEETIWILLPGSWMPLSLIPKETLGGLFLFSSCVAVFFATVQLVPSLAFSKKTLFFLSAGAGMFSLFGLFWFFFWPHSTAGIVEGGAFHPFAAVFRTGNGSDYPALMAMLLPPIVGLFLALHPRGSVFGFPGLRIGSLTLTPYHLRIITGLAALPVIGFLLVSSQVLTLLITLGGLLLLAALVMLRRIDGKRGAILVGVAVFFLLGVVLFHWGGGFFVSPGSGPGKSSFKVSEWEDGQETFRRFPVAGTGFGTSPILADSSDSSTGGKDILVVGQSYAGRRLAEGGLLGVALSVWFLTLVIRRCLQAWHRRKSRTSAYLFSGVLAGIVVLIVHGFTGLFLHPLFLGLYFSFLLGVLVSVSHSRSRSHGGESELAPMPSWPRRGGLVVGVGFGMVLVAFHGGEAVARIAADRDKEVVVGDGGQETIRPSQVAARIAARFDPLESRYRLSLGEGALAQEDKPLALKHLSAALKLNPLDGLALRRTGLLLSNSEVESGGEALLRAAAENHPGKAQHQWDYALWLCSRSRYQDSFPYLQRSFDLEPERAGELLLLMSACGLDDEQMQMALSDIPSGWVGYGDFLLSRGAEKEAEASYIASIRFATTTGSSLVLPFWRLHDFYYKHGRLQEALDSVLLGIQAFPSDPHLRQAAGTLYQQLGITYRAIEEYRKTLLFDPNNELARLGLKELTNGR